MKDLPLFYFFLAKEAFLELGGEKAWMSARIPETFDSPSIDEIELSRADLKRVKLLQSVLGTPSSSTPAAPPQASIEMNDIREIAYKKKVSQRLGKGSVFLFYRTFWNLFFELFARGRVRNLFSRRFGKGSELR